MTHPDAPAKVTALLDLATEHGLTVTRDETRGETHAWTISTPNPVDSTQVWLYWNPGQRGGRLSITVSYGAQARRNVTRRYARIALQLMAESLQRHLDREAAAAPKVTIEQARAAMAQVGHELNANAAVRRSFGTGTVPAHLQPKTARRPDPARPGWFETGQVIMDRALPAFAYTVADLERHPDGRTKAVLVATSGGYAWYGDHFQAVAPLSALEGPHIGRPERDTRPWPKSIYSAVEAVKLTLHDQRLRGYVLPAPNQRGVVVNLPRDTEPERHLVLLRRYLPYPAHVNLHQVAPPSEGHYVTLLITPKEG